MPSTFARRPCSGATLTRLLRPGIMAVLADGPAHGYHVAERLQSLRMFGAAMPHHTGIYRMLKAMQDEGLVVSKWELDGSGPARREFRLTRKGRACMSQWRATLADYRDAVDELLTILERT